MRCEMRIGKGKLLLAGLAVLVGFAASTQADEERRHEEERAAPNTHQGTARTTVSPGSHAGAPNASNREGTGAHAVPGTGGRAQGTAHEGARIERPTGRAETRPGAIDHEARRREGGEMRHDARWQRHEFHEHDVRRFGRDELVLWRGGQWRNSCYAGRCGWWWFVDGLWYFYERPIYPYPLEVSVVTYVEPVEVAPVVAVPAAPIVQQPPAPSFAPQQQQSVWYFCASANAYYPYVPSCPTGWQTVPAVPAANGPGPAAAAPPMQ